jgi:hypothetical protein
MPCFAPLTLSRIRQRLDGMSHKATYWLAQLDPARVKAGAFRVLFHLCDHHNDGRKPDTACFPSQETLMRKTALSNGGLNKCISDLESSGLLTRKRSTIPGKSTRRTYYILGCDVDAGINQNPRSGDSTNSTAVEAAVAQTPLFEEANSTFEKSKLHPSGEEPVKDPVIGKERTPIVPKSTFDDFWKIVPKRKARAAAKKAWFKAAKKTDPQKIIDAMMLYADSVAGKDEQYTAHPATWLNHERWDDDPPKQTPKTQTDDFHNQVSNLLGSTTDEQQRTNEFNPVRTQRLSPSV